MTQLSVFKSVGKAFRPKAKSLNLSAEILARNPIAYYKLDEVAGSTSFIDSSGNGLTISSISSINAGASPIASQGSACVEFPQNGRLELVDNDFIHSGSKTFLCWFRWYGLQGTDSFHGIMSNYDFAAGQRSLAIAIANTNTPVGRLVAIGFTTNESVAIAGTFFPNSNQTYMVALVWDSPNKNMHLYIDGSLYSSDTTTAIASNLETTNLFNVGSWTDSPNQAFNGKIDEAAVFHSALTASDINTIYNAGS